MKLPKNRESGQVLIMALILLALGSLLVVPLLNLSTTSLNYHQLIERKTLESYSADSGVEYVLTKLYNRPGAYTDPDNPLQASFNLNNRAVSVTAKYMVGGIYEVTSIATSPNGRSTKITCYVNLSAGAFAFVIAAKDYIKLSNVEVDSRPDTGEGNIHSNGNIVLGSVVSVNGDASAVGTITGQDSVTGMVTEGSSEIVFPGDYSQLYKAMAQEGGTYTGDYLVSPGVQEELGPLYIDGNLYVKPNATVMLQGPVYVVGDIEVQGGNLEGKEQIFTEGTLRMSGGGYGSETIPIFTATVGNIHLVGPIIDAVVYAPNGIVKLTNLDLYGAVGGKTIDISNARIFYDEELHGREDIPGGELHTIVYSYS